MRLTQWYRCGSGNKMVEPSRKYPCSIRQKFVFGELSNQIHWLQTPWGKYQLFTMACWWPLHTARSRHWWNALYNKSLNSACCYDCVVSSTWNSKSKRPSPYWVPPISSTEKYFWQRKEAKATKLFLKQQSKISVHKLITYDMGM